MMKKLCVCCLGVLALLQTGCGSKGVAVTGTVKRGGQPLPAGMLAFEPKANSGTTGAGTNLAIRDGKFEVGSEKQLTPGTYVVRVSPETIGSGMDLKKAPPQFKPWETTVEIKSDEEPLTLEMPMQ